MKIKKLTAFLSISFGLTWGIAALLIFFTDQMTAIFGEVRTTNPLYILAVYSPGIAGTFLIWKSYGFGGLGSFFRRMTLWKMPSAWWIYLIIGIPLLEYLSAALNGTISDPFQFNPWYYVFPAIGFALFLGTIEEFGWRGIALPLLQQKIAPFWAGLILGIIWAVWHIPAFLMSGTPFENWSFLPLFIGLISLSIILTPMFNSANGSLLIAYIYHFQMMNPIWPNTQPWENYVFTVAAIIVVILNRRTMFKKGSGISDVLMPKKS